MCAWRKACTSTSVSSPFSWTRNGESHRFAETFQLRPRVVSILRASERLASVEVRDGEAGVAERSGVLAREFAGVKPHEGSTAHRPRARRRALTGRVVNRLLLQGEPPFRTAPFVKAKAHPAPFRAKRRRRGCRSALPTEDSMNHLPIKPEHQRVWRPNPRRERQPQNQAPTRPTLPGPSRRPPNAQVATGQAQVAGTGPESGNHPGRPAWRISAEARPGVSLGPFVFVPNGLMAGRAGLCFPEPALIVARSATGRPDGRHAVARQGQCSPDRRRIRTARCAQESTDPRGVGNSRSQEPRFPCAR